MDLNLIISISHLMCWELTSERAPSCFPTLAVTELRLRPPTPRLPMLSLLASEGAASLLGNKENEKEGETGFSTKLKFQIIAKY